MVLLTILDCGKYIQNIKRPEGNLYINISISFDNEEVFVTQYPSNSPYVALQIDKPEISVVGRIKFDKWGNKTVGLDSTWLDGTSKFHGAYIHGLAKYEVSKESQGACEIHNASLRNGIDGFTVDSTRLDTEDPGHSRYLKKLYNLTIHRINNCLKERLCSTISPLIEAEVEKGNSIDTSSGNLIPLEAHAQIEEDESSESQSDGSEKDSGESSDEETEQVDIDTFYSSIEQELDNEESEYSDNEAIGIPTISKATLSCGNARFHNLTDIKLRGRESKIGETSEGIRVAVPLELREANAHYHCSYNLPSKNEYSSNITVKAMQLKFKAILLVKKIEGECKSSVERVITLHPGEVALDSDNSSEEDVAYPIKKLIENAWEIETILEVENGLHKVLQQKLASIRC
ncbi:hypothetical protein QAD02_015905 [Eretmocerus hayati]|uniref:Uncharacterized protein n=1 Tax=Eretmocerus hayati TaxID=131215 RepID=A0ACC2PAK9_9HYME|nr:hypothetical protein QAD02_015905 [Eretmocerus hayati]